MCTLCAHTGIVVYKKIHIRKRNTSIQHETVYRPARQHQTCKERHTPPSPEIDEPPLLLITPAYTPLNQQPGPIRFSPYLEHAQRGLLLSWRPGNCTVLQWGLTWNITADKYIQVFENQNPQMTSIVWMLLRARDVDSDAALAEELQSYHPIFFSLQSTVTDCLKCAPIILVPIQKYWFITYSQPQWLAPFSPHSSHRHRETGSRAHLHPSPSDPGLIQVCLLGSCVVGHGHPLGTEAPWTAMNSKMLITWFTSAFNTTNIRVFMNSSSELPPPTGAWIKDFVINWTRDSMLGLHPSSSLF